MHLAFDHPWILLAASLAVPCALLAWRSIPVLSVSSAVVGFAFRLGVIVLLALALARPVIGWSSGATSVVVAMDASASVPPALRDRAEREVSAAASRRRPGDRLGAVTFARRAEVVALPTADPAESLVRHGGVMEGSDVASAIRMALAVAPADTASRILLVSDGNATEGNAAEAAELARAAGIPVDVVPLRFTHEREVLVERMAAPARARAGQSVDLRLTLRSIGAASGRIELRHDGEPVDLDPASSSTGLAVDLEPGANLVVLPAVPGGGGAHRFEAAFVPDDPGADAIAENNRGAATVFVGGSGRVAVIEPEGATEAAALVEALRRGDIEVEAASVEQAMRGGLQWLAGFDAVVLANVPRWSVDNAFDRALHAYCHDAGGGLVMLGGPESFGAGGWNGSEAARAMPVRMDPPQTRVLLRAAVALVIDASGSMAAPVTAAGQTQQEVANEAAIAGLRSLSRLDEATVVSFSGEPDLVVPRAAIDDGRAMARAISGIQPCGGTNMFPAMELAFEQLRSSRARTRHMVVLTDGQTMGNDAEGVEIARRARAAGMTVSAISIGDGANGDLLRRIAGAGGGRFHAIDSDASARTLPQVFMRELSLEGRALVQEGDYVPMVSGGAGGPLAGISALPAVRGYVLTAAGDGVAQQGASIRVKEGLDPFLAWQNYGIGRSAALTGDLGGRWGAAWKPWPGFQGFCEQLMRWVMRPADDRSIETTVTMDGERATLRMVATEDRGGFAPALRLDARLFDPDGRVSALPVRQVGPGAFEAVFDARRTGAWMASVVSAREGADGSVRASTSHVAVSVPYAAEHRSVRDDAAALRTIAERSGGRVIEIDQLQSADLFDRTGLVASQGSRQVWDLLAMAAAALLVLDVAWRRIAFARDDASELLARVTGGASASAGAATAVRPTAGQAAVQEGESLERLRAARARAAGGKAPPA